MRCAWPTIVCTRTLLGRVELVVEEILRLTGDHGQRVIDLMSRSCRKFGKSVQFEYLQALVLACLLNAQGPVKFVHLGFQIADDRLLLQASLAGGQGHELAQHRGALRRSPTQCFGIGADPTGNAEPEILDSAAI